MVERVLLWFFFLKSVSGSQKTDHNGEHRFSLLQRGKDFTAPLEGETHQTVILTSNLRQNWKWPLKRAELSSRWVNCLSTLSVIRHTYVTLWAPQRSSIPQGKKWEKYLQRDWHQRGWKAGTISIKCRADKVQRNNLRIFLYLTCDDITPDDSIDCLLKPLVGTELRQIFQRYWGEGALWLLGPTVQTNGSWLSCSKNVSIGQIRNTV